MKFSVQYDPAFFDDFTKAAGWYKKISHLLAIRLIAQIRMAEKKLSSHPLPFKRFGKNGFRRIKVQKFPFYIYYFLEGAVVTVYAIIHTSRSNRFVNSRLL